MPSSECRFLAMRYPPSANSVVVQFYGGKTTVPPKHKPIVDENRVLTNQLIERLDLEH